MCGSDFVLNASFVPDVELWPFLMNARRLCLHDEQHLKGIADVLLSPNKLSRKTQIVHRQIKPPTCSDGNAVTSHNVLAVRLICIIHIYECALTTTLRQQLNAHVACGH